jgi:hypothetical protein
MFPSLQKKIKKKEKEVASIIYSFVVEEDRIVGFLVGQTS